MRHQLIINIIVLLFVINNYTYGQIQQGYVKTQGRPNKPGVPLSGVTIRVRGTMNSVLSGADGCFSFLMPDKKDGDALVLQQVRKQGYELCDRELIGRQLVFSTHVPIEIVINKRIENGELERADSLIHTVFNPNTILEQNRAAKAEIQGRMQLAQEIIHI
jgi:hypothetical protein